MTKPALSKWITIICFSLYLLIFILFQVGSGMPQTLADYQVAHLQILNWGPYLTLFHLGQNLILTGLVFFTSSRVFKQTFLSGQILTYIVLGKLAGLLSLVFNWPLLAGLASCFICYWYFQTCQNRRTVYAKIFQASLTLGQVLMTCQLSLEGLVSVLSSKNWLLVVLAWSLLVILLVITLYLTKHYQNLAFLINMFVAYLSLAYQLVPWSSYPLTNIATSLIALTLASYLVWDGYRYKRKQVKVSQ
ncbi:hypothetical protein AWM75_06130 [Aerococcus urinaehominis]|uniref:Uncharacterized protein n=1 Tax=Aerococcus urinaehominis TaxID=128944 RepID=A0A0X8FLS9_9LACT|nr:hypothetical protein [Aerococcus urinaehominis]AMB99582.1 hypothetical protein AWM75_06130 [Aerococcus urinaehominis]